MNKQLLITTGLAILSALFSPQVQAEVPDDGKMVYRTAVYQWNSESVTSDRLKASAESPWALRTNVLSRKGQALTWNCRNDISKYGEFTGTSVLETALYNLAVDEMVNNIEKDGTLRTGALWGGVWTRDVSYSAILSLFYMVPDNVRTSLEVKIDRLGRIIQDTGTGGSWPCSSDRVIWAVAAWKVYLATGDTDWLKKVYPVILKSLESDHHVLYDHRTGLYRGESSFIDWRQQSYPVWMQPADIYMSECLGTNVVYSKVFETVSMMAETLGEVVVAKDYRKRAADLKKAINASLWMQYKGYYGNFLYGRNCLMLSRRSETLGESLAILWDVADVCKSKRILAGMPVSDWGPAIFWPQISSQPDYHNNATWPFVTSYWGMAAAKSGNESVLLHALGSNVRSAALYATNYENFTNSTGNPYTTCLNSHNMLWGLSGFMGLFHKTFFGFVFAPDGLSFAPCVPKALEGERCLKGFPYRDMLLDIYVKGSGNKVRSFRLDGKTCRKPFVSAELTGRHEVVIELGGDFPESSINVKEYSPAPEYPLVYVQDGCLKWNAVGTCTYKIVHDSECVAETSSCEFPLPSGHKGEWQVIAVDETGTEGFASEPLGIYPLTVSVPMECRIDHTKGCQLKVDVQVPQDGWYMLDWRYTNGNGSVTGHNRCSTRTLFVDSQMQGVNVFPQRGEGDWKNAGWSSPLKLYLTEGTHTVQLHYLDTDVNMNIRTDNAVVKELRLRL